MYFWLVRQQLRQDATEAKRVFAQSGPHPVAAGGGGVAFVEHEIDDLEHGAESPCELFAAWHLERGARFGERLLCAYDALRGGCLRNHERARDLLRGEPAEDPKRQGNAALGAQQRMAGREGETQQVVTDV